MLEFKIDRSYTWLKFLHIGLKSVLFSTILNKWKLDVSHSEFYFEKDDEEEIQIYDSLFQKQR